jgi:hypothetical protein
MFFRNLVSRIEPSTLTTYLELTNNFNNMLIKCIGFVKSQRSKALFILTKSSLLLMLVVGISFLVFNSLILNSITGKQTKNTVDILNEAYAQKDIDLYLPARLNTTQSDSRGIGSSINNEDVLSGIYRDIEHREYYISYDEISKKWQSPNRRHNIRSFYEPGKWVMQNRIDSIGQNWHLQVITKGIYADGSILSKPEQGTKAITRNDTIEFIHTNFTEQYVNNKQGIRQNFIIHKALENTRQVEVKLQFKGFDIKKLSKTSIELKNNNQLITYSDLKVWDSKGKMIAAQMEANGDELSLVVNMKGASFPITIDPIIENGNSSIEVTTLESNQASAYMGNSVSVAGDVNGDGYSDVIVGAYLYDNGQANEGIAFVYHGSASGLSTTASATLECNQASAKMGFSVSGAGDLNGDGYDDIIVGADYYDNGQTNEGVVFVYHGSASGLSTTASATLESNQADAQLGYSVSGAGDVNGDGYGDIIVGAYSYDNGQTDEGAAFVYHGSAGGVSTTASAILESNQADAKSGSSVSEAGDVNGDGYSDVIVGAMYYDNGQTNEGIAFVYHGSASGVNSAASATLESNQASAYMGRSVSGAGDVNGDGYGDVIVGASDYDNGQNDEGVAFVYHGSVSGVSTTASATLESNQTIAYLGWSVSGAGDVNGDGYSDVIVGAHLYDNGQTNEGAAFVYQGSASGVGFTALAILESNQADARLGYSVSGAGDVNGDGYSDLIVGADFYDKGQSNEGAAFVYHGSADGVSSTTFATLESNNVNAWFGCSVSVAGDVNGDGYNDVIVGATGYDNGQSNEGAAFVYQGSASGISTTASATLELNQAGAQLGYSVSGAGDVNGDGYSDVIVGAHLHDNGQTDEGAAFVYHGSVSGISTTPSSILESNQAGAQLGYSVSGAGDVNGDGYSDVIVGAPKYSNGQSLEGAAFVYYGSVSGVSTSGSVTVESNQAYAYLGWSVSGAGDVNDDGFCDVIVGAYLYGAGGAAFVYHGLASGVSTTASVILEPNVVGARSGFSVSGAGDVNGDGFSDVIVGAYMYDNGQNNEGAAFVYHGSASGVSTTASATLESNQADAQLGYSVSGAGDVNGDGYGDIIVGAPFYDKVLTNEGAAFIYHGSTNGVSITANVTFESKQAYAKLGCSVSGAGDLNNDGYSDQIVGASNYDNGQDDEGAAFVYYSSGIGASAIIESNQANARLGYSVSWAGDVNGDGYSDVIVGAPYYDNGQTDEGAAFVYHGTARGLSTSASITIESNQAGALLGRSVSGAGDLNADGYADVIVGSIFYNNGQTNEGAAFVHHGSASGVSTIASVTLESNQADAQLGYSVSAAGDVNGDGYSDIIVGAPYYDDGQTNEGAAFIYHGSASGVSTTASVTFESNQVGAYLGYSVSGAGDVNGDGYSDVIVGASYYDNGQTNEGAAFVYHGSASGASNSFYATLESNQESAYMGISVSGAGDVNGDGYSDVIVGAYYYHNGQYHEGAAFVYHGSASGVSTIASASLESNQAYAQLGYSVSGAGDVNGDGYGDIIVGAFSYDNGLTDEGAAFIYNGSASGLSTTASDTIESNQADAALGISVSGAGDVNGDGYSDVIVGASNFKKGQTDEGVAFVYHGSASGASTTVSATLESNQLSAKMGFSVSWAGDVNGDGYGDIIVGAPYYDNGQTDEGVAFVFLGSASGFGTTASATLESNQADARLGISVSGAGDVNGDGYGDVIVGATSYDKGQADEGAAFVYHGSASGLSTTASATLESNQADARLGVSVSGAGDVNGDGYSDVIVGAYYYDKGQTNEGAAFVYHGSASGVSTTASATLESNQASANLGRSVSGAGDLNGDGYNDVVVGAPYYDKLETDEGAAFVYHGSASGLSTTASATLESNQASAHMGWNVSVAGDVDGDGYSDIIVGVPYYDNGQADEGAAFVYHGSASGVSITASAILESNQADARLGYSVSGAGDVNGDGYSDLISGAPYYDNGQSNEGAAFLYLGSPSGVSTTTSATLESNQIDANLGYSVSEAGDANGDGFSDVIAGAYLYNNGQTDEGAVFVYHGNAGGGLRRNLLLFNTSTTNLITQSNILQNDFAVGLFARSPDGRTKAKLVWETKGEGQAFSSFSTITNSTQYTAMGAAFTDLGLSGTQITENIDKELYHTKVRVRIMYSPVTSLNGQVYSPWIYSPGFFSAQGMSSTPLPVSLLSFYGECLHPFVSLKWETASETNNDYYTIERSVDATEFEIIDTIKGAGNSNTTLYYQFTDNLSSINSLFSIPVYYRLKQIDFNGQSEYSKIIAITCPNENLGDINVYPNPTTNELTIEISGSNETVNCEFINSLGIVVHRESITQVATINIAQLPPGLYIIKVENGNLIEFKKIVKK